MTRVPRVSHLFLSLLVVIGTATAGVMAWSYHADVESLTASIADQERTVVARMQDAISGILDAIVGDLLFLTDQNELAAWLSGDDQARAAIAAEYLALASHRKVYDQIRFLDASGREQVRVNFNAGRPSVIPDDRLQDKSQRYYFRDVIVLSPGEIFVSPFDLNIEQGAIEVPFKPMIRIGTPVTDASGRPRGVVLLNYLGAALLDRLADVGRHSVGDVTLLNAEGHWLLAAHPDDAWGFMIEGRAGRRFGVDHPDEWGLIGREKAGQRQTPNGLFTFATVSPLEAQYHSSTGASAPDAPSRARLAGEDYNWVAVSHVPTAALAALKRPILLRTLAIGAGVFILLGLGAWLLAIAVVRWREYEARLLTMAHYDSLTGLANRTLFFDRLSFVHSNAERYSHTYGLLFLDLDGFKEINDRLGHQAGDTVLIEVASRIKGSLRRSDTVARLGGDELAVILTQCEGAESVQALGNKLTGCIAEPLAIGQDQVRVGVSIGAALYPSHGLTGTEILRSADRAMYQAKNGTERVCIATSTARVPEAPG